MAVTGLNLTFDTTMVLMVLCLASTGSVWGGATAGFVGGLMFLHRYNQLPIAGAVIWSLLRAGRRRDAALFAVAMASTVLPWVLASVRTTGVPLLSFTGWAMFSHATAVAPYDPWYWFRFPTPLEMVRDHLWLAQKKFAEDVLTIGERLIIADGRVVIWGLAAIGVAFNQPPRAAAMAWAVAAGLGATGIGNAVLSRSHAYLLWALALASVWAGRGAWVFGRHIELVVAWRGREIARVGAPVLAAAIAALVAAWDSGGAFRSAQAGRGEERWDLETDTRKMRWIAARVPGDGVVVAGNAPWNIAWYGDRAAIPIPPDARDIEILEQRYGLKIAGLYVPARLDVAGDGGVPGGWQAYRMAATSGRLRGFVLDERFSDGSVFFRRVSGVPIDLGDHRADVDMGESGDELAAVYGFSWRERDGEGRSFRWSEGPASTLSIQLARGGRAVLRATIYALDEGEISVLANARTVGRLKPQVVARWHEAVVELGELSQGENLVTLIYASTSRRGGRNLSVAYDRIRVEIAER